MSIRTSEKRKLPPYDSLTETQPEQTSKHSKNAKPPKDKDTRSQNEVCILLYITLYGILLGLSRGFSMRSVFSKRGLVKL